VIDDLSSVIVQNNSYTSVEYSVVVSVRIQAFSLIIFCHIHVVDFLLDVKGKLATKSLFCARIQVAGLVAISITRFQGLVEEKCVGESER
jgi:hypothetical protein